jgi:hypothetical protein
MMRSIRFMFTGGLASARDRRFTRAQTRRKRIMAHGDVKAVPTGSDSDRWGAFVHAENEGIGISLVREKGAGLLSVDGAFAVPAAAQARDPSIGAETMTLDERLRRWRTSRCRTTKKPPLVGRLLLTE